MANTYWLETYGCEMNKAESSALEEKFHILGWQPADTIETASAIILHTCAVRQSAEDRLWGRLKEVKAKKLKEAMLCVVGCMATYRKKAFEDCGVDFILGNFDKLLLPEFLEKNTGPNDFEIVASSEEYCFPSQYGKRKGRLMLPIMHGCNNFCSYCIVPYLRGREVSRNPSSILEEISMSEEEGLKELILLGQNVNSYFWEEGKKSYNFTQLLKTVTEETRVPWIRFLTSHPKDISPELIEIIKTEEKICNHIHLPVQHGSNKILKRMNRGYTREQIFRLVETLRTKNPDLAITTDILIGFPGEDENDFSETLSLMSKIEFDDAFTYYYNPREGNEAYSMSDLPKDLKKRRLAEIIDLQREISRKKKEERLGKRTLALVESISKKWDHELLGRTEWNDMVVFPGDQEKIGSFVVCDLHSVEGNTLRGKEVQ